MIGENYMKQIILSLKHWVNNNFALKESIPEVPVTSVNNMTGDVIIEIPEGFSGSWNDLQDKPFDETNEYHTVYSEGELLSGDSLYEDGDYFDPRGCKLIFGYYWDGDWCELAVKGIYDESNLYSTYIDEETGLHIGFNYEGVATVTSTPYDCPIEEVFYYEEILHTLDEKFIPDTIARVSDVSPAIIDVTELPVENIDENALYRIFEPILISANTYVSMDISKVYPVTELPVEPKIVHNPDTGEFNVYYLVSEQEAYGYITEPLVSSMNIPEGWYPISILLEGMDITYLGAINDTKFISIADKETIAILLRYNFYYYQNGHWYPIISKTRIWEGLDNKGGQITFIPGSLVIGGKENNVTYDSIALGAWNKVNQHSLVIGEGSEADIGSLVVGAGAIANYESVAFGYDTKATSKSFAHGFSTIAQGSYSHAEGVDTEALGEGSHSEGHGTIAQGEYQHVSGIYNIIDSNNECAYIVGNGTSYINENRSNAHTLDWSGNAWFAGDVYVDSTSGTNRDSGSVKLARISDIPDLSTYELITIADIDAICGASIVASSEVTF